jgi:hypothetical protein
MLAILLKVATLYLIIGVAVLVGIGIGSDFTRWLKGRQQSRQRVAQRLGGSAH